uniref:Uncharacterized protein n=1 Tax=Leersia perrieri TaxID=77586 RepID=A0A0D9WIA3_9ORYZ
MNICSKMDSQSAILTECYSQKNGFSKMNSQLFTKDGFSKCYSQSAIHKKWIHNYLTIHVLGGDIHSTKMNICSKMLFSKCYDKKWILKCYSHRVLLKKMESQTLFRSICSPREGKEERFEPYLERRLVGAERRRRRRGGRASPASGLASPASGYGVAGVGAGRRLAASKSQGSRRQGRRAGSGRRRAGGDAGQAAAGRLECSGGANPNPSRSGARLFSSRRAVRKVAQWKVGNFFPKSH